jgi:hypothetical protein
LGEGKMKKALALIMAPLLISATDINGIEQDAIRAHVEFLASDELEGRDTGTRGYDIAALYVAERFRSAGLQPAGTKGWYQPIRFASMLVDNQMSAVTIGKERFANRKDVLFGGALAPGSEVRETDIVFGGYCIDDPKLGQNDFKGLNIKGKMVACLFGFPKNMKSDMGAHYSRYKAEMIERRGGTGLIVIRTLERERRRPWTREVEGPQRPTLGWVKPDGTVFTRTPRIGPVLTLHDKAAQALFAGSATALESILAEADKKDGRPKGFALKQRLKLERTTAHTALDSPNVIGVLPGSDPLLAKEHVVVMAHLDHNGIDQTRTGDKIYNGAMDNASGTAMIIEAARVIAAGPRPKRSILFVSVTAEERGLLGSDYLARHPVVADGGKVVAVVNIDMPILLYDFQDVIAYGSEHSTLGPIVDRASKSLGLTLADDPLPTEGFFTRSDHYSFVLQGVPAVSLKPGFKNGGDKQFEDFLKNHYHRVSDDLSLPFDWNAAAKFGALNLEIVRGIANDPKTPQWYDDSFFGQKFSKGTMTAKQ